MEINPEETQFVYVVSEGKRLHRFLKPLVVKEFNLSKGQRLTGEVLSRIIETEQILIRRAWVQALARKSYLKEDLRKKLLGKGFSAEGVAREIEECTRRGYLDDRAQLERMISKILGKGHGALAVYASLKQKGVILPAEDRFHQIIREQEKEGLKAFLKKKKGKDLSGPRGIRYLLQRGYRYEVICDFVEVRS